jgi:predicted phosphoribosyltransferase
MCISWIEASLLAKDNMSKSGRGAMHKEIYFTDDGFAMGVAMCLAILKQVRSLLISPMQLFITFPVLLL